MATTSPYFAVHPDWRAFAEENEIDVDSDTTPEKTSIECAELPVDLARQFQEQADQKWIEAHPLSSVNYEAYSCNFPARDGTLVNIRLTYPSASRLSRSSAKALPVVFVAHGGGYISGSHLSEEAWLVRPLQANLDLVTVSVEYRLAPEHKFPTWINDTWDVLEELLLRHGETIPAEIRAKMDFERVILAGSSAGGGICAVLSHMCRDRGLKPWGVVLNVPMLCEYRSFPSSTGISQSYLDCNQGMLGSAQLASCWDLLLTSKKDATDPRLSPLLGSLNDLPRHIVCVAGRDPLREDGLSYASRLKEASIPVKLHVYKGVPHAFAQNEDLSLTKSFVGDVVGELRSWLEG